MAEIIVDESKWPLVVVRYPAEYDLQDWLTHGNRLNSILDREVPFAYIAETSMARPANSAERKISGDSHRARHAAWEKYCLGCGVVLRSAINRGVLTAIQWLHPYPYPMEAFATYEQAETWVLRKLREGPQLANARS